MSALRFLRPYLATFLLFIAASLAVAAAKPRSDFSGTGTSDLLWRNSSTGQVFLMPMKAGVVQPGTIIYTEPNPAWQIVSTSDFDGDGKADILWYNNSTGQVYQMLMDGTAIRSASMIYTESNTDWKIAGTGDFDGNGKADLLWRNSTTGAVYLMPLNGAAVLPGTVIYTEANPAWQIVAVADFDGDSKADILWWNSSTGQVYLMLMNGTAIKSASMVYTEPNTAWKIIGSGDFNGDGTADILWRNLSTGQVFEMPMLKGVPQPGSIVWTEASLAWQIVALGDFDGDGKDDILWWNCSTGQVFQMLMDGTTVKAARLVYVEPVTQWTIQAGGFPVSGQAPIGRTLTGTYRFSSTDYVLWKASGAGTPVYNAFFGNGGTFTFTDRGVCTFDYSGYEFTEQYSGAATTGAPDLVRSAPQSVSARQGAYTVSADGHLVVTTSDGTLDAYVSHDGKTIATGGAHTEARADGTMYVANTLLAFKSASSMNLSSAAGTYVFYNNDRTMHHISATSRVLNGLGSNLGVITFDGVGGCSITYSFMVAMENYGSTTVPWATRVDVSAKEGITKTGTYTVSSDGHLVAAVATGTLLDVYLSEDASMFMATPPIGIGSIPAGTSYDAGSCVGTRVGTGMGVASLNGTYRMHSSHAELFHSTASTMVFNGMYGQSGTVVLDGNGVYTMTYTDQDTFERYATGWTGPWANAVTELSESKTFSGSYAVTTDGKLTFSGFNIQFQVSPDGRSFAAGGPASESVTGGMLYSAKEAVAIKVQ